MLFLFTTEGWGMEKFEEQTLKIWDELVKLAEARTGPETYGQFVTEHDLGLARDIGQKLDPIFYFCRCNNLPMITDLLKNTETNLPSNRPGITKTYYAELVEVVNGFDWAGAIKDENLRCKLVAFVAPPEIDSKEGKVRKHAAIFKSIKCALDQVSKGERTNEIHLQMLKYADQLDDVTAREFCEQAGLTESYQTEFSKMRKMLERLKTAGLDVTRI
eukprot:TRINITY_DN16628_c0_g1_i1.p1 TRINITY_DN16628_c0_g1~~TRINITY_DN16628_c0_g1_i1.p1  ORF type:complete len:217 (-),score=13.00 TRINITY_DN16628_c0_g1_i1:359-1009(-)